MVFISNDTYLYLVKHVPGVTGGGADILSLIEAYSPARHPFHLYQVMVFISNDTYLYLVKRVSGVTGGGADILSLIEAYRPARHPFHLC
jgi:hypothetical protein